MTHNIREISYCGPTRSPDNHVSIYCGLTGHLMSQTKSLYDPMADIKESLDQNRELNALMMAKIENLEKEVAELRAEIDGMPGGPLEAEGKARYEQHTKQFNAADTTE